MTCRTCNGSYAGAHSRCPACGAMHEDEIFRAALDVGSTSVGERTWYARHEVAQIVGIHPTEGGAIDAAVAAFRQKGRRMPKPAPRAGKMHMLSNPAPDSWVKRRYSLCNAWLAPPSTDPVADIKQAVEILGRPEPPLPLIDPPGRWVEQRFVEEPEHIAIDTVVPFLDVDYFALEKQFVINAWIADMRRRGWGPQLDEPSEPHFHTRTLIGVHESVTGRLYPQPAPLNKGDRK